MLSGLDCVLSEVYHITPLPSDPCPMEHCFTLSQLAGNSTNYLNTTNTTLVFLPGNHSLQSQIKFFANVTTVSVLANSTLSTDSVIILCGSDARFEFVGVNNVYMSGLKFVGCTGNRVESVDQFTLEDSSFVGQEDINGTALELNETSANLVQTSFNSNKGDKVHHVECVDASRRRTKAPAMAGGAISVTRSKITIVQSIFEENSAEMGGAIYSELNSNITIINSTFVGNHATSIASYRHCYVGGGILYDSGSTVITIADTKFMDNSTSAQDDGGAVYLSNAINTTITITDSEFTNISAHYNGGAVYLFRANNTTVTIIDSEFINSSAQYFGGAVYFEDAINTTMTITDSKFMDSSAQYSGGAVCMFGVTNTTIMITSSEF